LVRSWFIGANYTAVTSSGQLDASMPNCLAYEVGGEALPPKGGDMASHIPLPRNPPGCSQTKVVRGFCPPTLPYRRRNAWSQENSGSSNDTTGLVLSCPLSRSHSCRGGYLSGEGYKKAVLAAYVFHEQFVALLAFTFDE